MGGDYRLEELLPIVAKLAERYTSYESTSVTYEKAEQLMGAVLYCIREAESVQEQEPVCERICDGIYREIYEKCGKRGLWKREGLLIPEQERSAQQAYEAGVTCVERKVKAALNLYNELMPWFDSYGNRCLYDTVVKGIPEFFRWYDIRYAPQDTILTLDYPILRDLTAYSGIDRIYAYLECIWLEQEFLGSFSGEYVINVLSQYHPSYEEMIDNICEVVYLASNR